MKIAYLINDDSYLRLQGQFRNVDLDLSLYTTSYLVIDSEDFKLWRVEPLEVITDRYEIINRFTNQMLLVEKAEMDWIGERGIEAPQDTLPPRSRMESICEMIYEDVCQDLENREQSPTAENILAILSSYHQYETEKPTPRLSIHRTKTIIILNIEIAKFKRMIADSEKIEPGDA